jgi:large subunit ribosomal protein L23
MKIEPVITEKSTELAKKGKYTFRFNSRSTKSEIKRLINQIFAVNVTGVNIIKSHGETKNSLSRSKRIVKPSKKAIVTLRDKQKIDIFESKKK